MYINITYIYILLQTQLHKLHSSN